MMHDVSTGWCRNRRRCPLQRRRNTTRRVSHVLPADRPATVRRIAAFVAAATTGRTVPHQPDEGIERPAAQRLAVTWVRTLGRTVDDPGATHATSKKNRCDGE